MQYSIRKRLIYALTHNADLKGIALISSLFIWFWVQTKQTDQEKFRAQVEYVLPDGLVLLNQPPPVVSVLLEGPKGAIRQFSVNPSQGEKLGVEINLSGSKEGTSNPEFTSNDVYNLPSDLKVLQFSPPIVNIVLEKQLTRNLNIEPQISGKPKKGWKLVQTTVKPDIVTVQGAQSILSNLVSIQTMGISISERNKSGIEEIGLEKKHPSFQFKGLEKVSVELIFEPIISTRTLTNIPIIMPEGWTANISSVDLSIEGPMLEIDSIKATNLSIIATPPENIESGEPIIPQITVFNQQKTMTIPYQITETILLKEVQ